MARDLDTLLKEFQALAAASNEPGRLTSAQVDAQLERLFAELMAALASLGSSWAQREPRARRCWWMSFRRSCAPR